MEPYDLIVVGAGVCGLIAARDALKLGGKVKILEASSRIGGQVWCIDHVGTRKTIALGAEWLNGLKHEQMFNEFKRYNISLDTFKYKHQYVLYGGKGEKAKISEHHKFINDLKTDPVYVSAMKTINWDVSFICFKDGFFQPDSDQYDMPLAQYVTQRLQVPVTSPVYEFILSQVFHITGGNPATQSALGVLYTIAGYRTAEKAFSIESELLHRYPTALSQYLKALAEEIDELGGEIDFEKPVVEVRKEEILLPVPRVPNYDYPPLPDRKRTVYVKCAFKEEIAARAVIMAVPMKCLATIRFDPPLPLELRQAAERCNAGVEQMKMYAFAAGISNDIGRLCTQQYECLESYTIARHHKYNASAAAEGSLTAAGVLNAAASAKQQNNRRTLTVTYNRTRPKSAPDEHQQNNTLICTNGSRHDLLHNLARNLRKIYPVIELQNDKIGNTPASSRPSTTASGARVTVLTSSGTAMATGGRGVGGRSGGGGRGGGGGGGGVAVQGEFGPAAPPLPGAVSWGGTSTVPNTVAAGASSTGTISAPLRPSAHGTHSPLYAPSPSAEDRIEAPEDINTSEYTVSHDGAVIYHDFLTDVCIRGTWFNLRAGTAHLHVLASRAARMPWHGNHRTSAYAASVTTSQVGGRSKGGSAVRTFVDPHTPSQSDPDNTAGPDGKGDNTSSNNGHSSVTQAEDLSLIIAGAELHPEWTGWLEGAVLSGALAAKRVHPYLFPPMVPRNYAKFIAPPSPEKSIPPTPETPIGSPKFSPALDRRRRML